LEAIDLPGLKDGLIGRRVKEARLKLGLTQERLAARANLHYSYVGQVERGNKVPSLKTLSKIARALNLKVEDLIGDNESERKSNITSRDLLAQELMLLVRDCPENELKLYIRLISQIKKHLENLQSK
jgi:transcriptional regulator with XRE-family HTH domain